MRALLSAILALPVVFVSPATAAQPLPADAADNWVVATPHYDFHVDFWANLHDYLYWRAQDSGPSAEGEACIGTRSGSERVAWQEVEEYYRTELKDRHWRRDPVMASVRYTLSGVLPQPDSMTSGVFGALRKAAPVYRACFWDSHQNAARERLADVVPHLLVLGPAVQEQLGRYYEASWPEAIHVDVVPYASYAGANTSSGRDRPSHMQISSIDPDLAGLSGLELLLHEASHEIFGNGRGLVGETIDGVSRSLGVGAPRDLWHAASFFTSGYVMEEVTQAVGLEYRAYGARSGLFQRAWPEYVDAFEEHWTPYLRGEIGVEEAMRRVISALIE